jgi:hypothetical protein
MKRFTLLLISILFAFSFLQAQIDRTQPPKPGKAQKIQLGDYQTFKLDNG